MKLLINSCIVSALLISTAGASVPAVNKLGLKLGHEVSKTLQGENFMISPVSLHQAVSIAANGTDHETRREVEELLESSVEENNIASQRFVNSLTSAQNRNKFVHFNKGNVVSIQNSIWRTNGKTDGRLFIFSPEFEKLSSEYYNAEAFALDFKDQDASKNINKWAEIKTNGLVKEIIDADTLSPMLWVIMNATYMEASWAKPFQVMKEEAPAFTLLNQSKVKVKMISGRQNISYSRLPDGSEVAAIPFRYQHGSPELEFIVYLPEMNKNFKEAQTEFFSMDFIKTVKSELSQRRNRATAIVRMPKFSFDTSVEMKRDEELTMAMNLNFLFQKRADFSLMATPESLPSIVGLIKQNSRIELDEKGVKAAAITIIGGIERTSIPADPTVEMTVDRPFMFAIVEKSSNAILFTGSVVDPR